MTRDAAGTSLGHTMGLHSRLSELGTALGLRRDPLFLTGLLYQEPGGPLRRVAAVASCRAGHGAAGRPWSVHHVGTG